MQTQFRLRAGGLRFTAYGILCLIFLLLVGGASAFVLAPQIASSDLHTVNDIDKKLSELNAERDQLQNRAEQAKKSLEEVYSAYRALFGEYSREQRKSPGIVVPAANLTIDLNADGSDKQWVLKKLDEMDSAINPINILVSNPPGIVESIYSISSDKLGEIRTRIATLNLPLLLKFENADGYRMQLLTKAINQLYSEKTKNAVLTLIGLKQSEPGEDKPVAKSDQAVLAQLVQTNVTRFGTIIMITFLVSILTPLYRYNIRLAAYYDARADVLELLKSDLKKVGFSDLVVSLTPSLDFGKAPSTPIEQIIELARHIAGDKSKSSEKPE